MSFSSDTKNEIMQISTEKKCCMLAEIAGYMRVNGSIGLLGGGRMSVSVTSESPAAARHFKKMLQDYYGTRANLEVSTSNYFGKANNYRLSIDDGYLSEQILRETGMMTVKEGSNMLRADIAPEIIKKKCCKKAYLRGLFVGAGTISSPEKGYHLEIVCSNDPLAQAVRKLINSFGLNSRVMERRGKYVVYLKGAEQIVDFLNIAGAHSQLLDVENVRVVKDMRNRTNRIVNCESANLDRTVDAAGRQIANIKYIQERVGLALLPARLQEAARLRMENKELNLAELAEMADPPVSKSGLNHRFAKIDAFADQLRESEK